MRKLHLLRHAKSSWDDPTLADVDRPLAPRGERAAAAMREHLSRVRLDPDLVLVSPSRRTRETWEAVAPALSASVTVRIEPSIYLAASDDLLDLVRGLDDQNSEVLLVGHDPGCHDLAVTLAGEGDERQLALLRAKYPTGTLASFLFSGSWCDITPRCARLASFVRPRDLLDED